jgi:hypothetical protein
MRYYLPRLNKVEPKLPEEHDLPKPDSGVLIVMAISVLPTKSGFEEPHIVIVM